MAWIWRKPTGEQLLRWREKVDGKNKILSKSLGYITDEAAKEIKMAWEKRTPLLLKCARAENLPLDGSSVDYIITSPPYNLGAEKWPMGGEGRRERFNGIGYIDNMPEEKYQEWQLKVINELYRVAKDGASFLYNHKVRQREGTIIHPLDWLRKKDNPWTIRQEIIWDRMSTHNHSKTLFWPHDERIYWMTKGSPRMPRKSVGLPTIIRVFGPIPNTWHPAPFNEDLIKKIISAICIPHSTILDPFGGSMVVCKVALALGHNAIGIDINDEYIKTASKENGWNYG